MTRWRVGRSVGRTIYIQDGPDPTKGDTLIGMMDTRELAARVVNDHNAMERVREDHRLSGRMPPPGEE